MDLKSRLDDLYGHFNLANSVSDPIWIVRRYSRPDDQEIVAFCAAALAFGRVQSVLNSIDGLLAVMGPSPAAYVRAFEPARDKAAFAHLVHRWTRGADLAALVWILHQMLARSGSIEAFFAEGLAGDAVDVGAALESFSDARAGARREGRVRPRDTAARRRLLLLEAFVRRRVQAPEPFSPLGGTPGQGGRGRMDARASEPVNRAARHARDPRGQCLRLTRYKSPGWRMAADITRSLRAIDPDDPVKYDFSICHVGMMNACGFGRGTGDGQCPLRGACHPGRLKKPRPSPNR